MMAINRYRLRAMARLGNRAAQRTAALLAQTDRLLGVILLGNNLINAAAATLAGVIAIELFGAERAGARGRHRSSITFLILVFSEITPKVVGATFPEKIALPLSYVLAPLLKLLYPVVWFVNLFVTGSCACCACGRSRRREPQRLSQEELRSLVLERSHIIPKKHRAILVNLFDLEAITVDDVMTPRAQIEALDLDAPADEHRPAASRRATTRGCRSTAASSTTSSASCTCGGRSSLLREGELDKAALAELLRRALLRPGRHAALDPAPVLPGERDSASRSSSTSTASSRASSRSRTSSRRSSASSPPPRRCKASGFALGRRTAASSSTAPRSLRELNRKLGLALPLDGPEDAERPDPRAPAGHPRGGRERARSTASRWRSCRPRTGW